MFFPKLPYFYRNIVIFWFFTPLFGVCVLFLLCVFVLLSSLFRLSSHDILTPLIIIAIDIEVQLI